LTPSVGQPRDDFQGHRPSVHILRDLQTDTLAVNGERVLILELVHVVGGDGIGPLRKWRTLRGAHAGLQSRDIDDVMVGLVDSNW
jgi:hypothetical protein